MQQEPVTNPNELDAVNNFIHDCKFEIDKICFDPETHTLRFEFLRENTEKRQVTGKFFFIKKYSIPTEKWILKFNHVKEYRYLPGDQAGPGPDDYFNFVAYDQKDHQVKINTVIGNGVSIKTSGLEVEIIPTNTTVETKPSYSLF